MKVRDCLASEFPARISLPRQHERRSRHLSFRDVLEQLLIASDPYLCISVSLCPTRRDTNLMKLSGRICRRSNGGLTTGYSREGDL